MKRFSMKKALTLHQHPFKNNHLNICQKIEHRKTANPKTANHETVNHKTANSKTANPEIENPNRSLLIIML